MHALWRSMARIVDQRASLRRPTKILLPMGQTLWKPTKTGIALRLNEWPTFKQAVDKLHRDSPTVANFTPCFLNVDHTHHSRDRRDLFGVQSDHLLTTTIERCT